MAGYRILMACGTGIATSTAAADRIKRLLKAKGMTVTNQECKAAEIAKLAPERQAERLQPLPSKAEPVGKLAREEWRVPENYGDRLRAYHRVGADTVLDQHRLLPVLAQSLADDAGQNVGRAPRRERHNDADRTAGVTGGFRRCSGLSACRHYQQV